MENLGTLEISWWTLELYEQIENLENLPTYIYILCPLKFQIHILGMHYHASVLGTMPQIEEVFLFIISRYLYIVFKHFIYLLLYILVIVVHVEK